jgi:hypothetical protein
MHPLNQLQRNLSSQVYGWHVGTLGSGERSNFHKSLFRVKQNLRFRTLTEHALLCAGKVLQLSQNTQSASEDEFKNL